MKNKNRSYYILLILFYCGIAVILSYVVLSTSTTEPEKVITRQTMIREINSTQSSELNDLKNQVSSLKVENERLLQSSQVITETTPPQQSTFAQPADGRYLIDSTRLTDYNNFINNMKNNFPNAVKFEQEKGVSMTDVLSPTSDLYKQIDENFVNGSLEEKGKVIEVLFYNKLVKIDGATDDERKDIISLGYETIVNAHLSNLQYPSTN